MREGEGGSSPWGLGAANLQPGAQNEGSAKPNFRAAAVLDEVKGIYNSPLTHGAQGARAGDIHKEWFPFRKLLPSFRVSAKPSKTGPEVSLWIPSLAHRAVAILSRDKKGKSQHSDEKKSVDVFFVFVECHVKLMPAGSSYMVTKVSPFHEAMESACWRPGRHLQDSKLHLETYNPVTLHSVAFCCGLCIHEKKLNAPNAKESKQG